MLYAKSFIRQHQATVYCGCIKPYLSVSPHLQTSGSTSFHPYCSCNYDYSIFEIHPCNNPGLCKMIIRIRYLMPTCDSKFSTLSSMFVDVLVFKPQGQQWACLSRDPMRWGFHELNNAISSARPHQVPDLNNTFNLAGQLHFDLGWKNNAQRRRQQNYSVIHHSEMIFLIFQHWWKIDELIARAVW